MIDRLTVPIDQEPVVFIGGPTASGKTGLAVSLAKELNAEVINADSVQLYRELHIGAARASIQEQGGVRHHLFDVLSPADSGSAAAFVEQALASVSDIQKRGRRCIVVGGTGMYATALVHGLADLPARNQALRLELEALSVEERFERLKNCDLPSSETLHPNDTLRVIRAIEVTELSGIPYSKSIREHGLKDRVLRGLFLVLCHERDRLYDRIDRRSEEMIQQGLIQEVQMLIERYGADAPALKSLGYSQVVEFLQSDGARSELVEQIAQQTRRFAKRQMTFWRNEPAKRGWTVVPEQDGTQAYVGSTTERFGAKRRMRGFAVIQPDLKELSDLVLRRFTKPFLQNEVWYLDAVRLSDCG